MLDAPFGFNLQKLEKYLHYYKDITVTYHDWNIGKDCTGTLRGIICGMCYIQKEKSIKLYEAPVKTVQPHLRRLSSLTDEEKEKIFLLECSAPTTKHKVKIVDTWLAKPIKEQAWHIKTFNYLLFLQVDLFEIINYGLPLPK